MSWFNKFSKYDKTNYNGGGLLEDFSLDSLSADAKVYTEPQFVAPRKIDNRDMCLATNDQGRTSLCAAYSMAGYLEFQNWKTNHYPEQINPEPIYNEAKIIDGNSNPGTYLQSVAQAVINLGLVKGTPKHINRSELDVKFAIHQFGVCIAGFRITNEWNTVETSTGKILIINESTQRGGHAVLLNGYDNDGIYLQNSWSPNWGIHGFAILPWSLFNAELMDALVITQ